MKLIYIILAAILISSCITEKKRNEICSQCPAKTIEKIVIKDSIITINRDSLVILPEDSSTIEMLLKCDSIGKVYIELMKQKDGKHIRTKIVFKDNILQIKAFNDSIAVLHKIIDRYKEVRSDSVATTTKIVYECHSWKHNLLKWWFYITVIMTLFIAGLAYARSKIPF
jgi:hypothetical protein